MGLVRVTCVNTKGMEDAISRSPFFASKQRIERTEHYIYPRSRILSYAAELALSYATSGDSLNPPKYEYDDMGKPVLLDGRFISLSHSGAVAVCAISDSPVGVDVEKQRIVSDMLKRRVLTKREQSELQGLSITGARQRYLLRRWVQKESYLKLTGEGLAGGMASVECVDGVVKRNGQNVGYVSEFMLSLEASSPHESVIWFLNPKEWSSTGQYFGAVASTCAIELVTECLDNNMLFKLLRAKI